MGLFDNNNVAIVTRNGSFTTAQTFALSGTGDIISISGLSKLRNKWLAVKATFANVAIDTTLRIDSLCPFYDDLGRLWRGIYSGKQVIDWRHDSTNRYHCTMFFPLASVAGDSFTLRNNAAASEATATITYSYAFIDPFGIEAVKPTQFITQIKVTPTGTGSFANEVVTTYTLPAYLQWFKYFFVKVIPVNSSGEYQSGTNYDMDLQRRVWVDSELSDKRATTGSEHLVINQSTPFVSDMLPMNTDTGWRVVFNINTYVAGTTYVVEFYGVR